MINMIAAINNPQICTGRFLYIKLAKDPPKHRNPKKTLEIVTIMDMLDMRRAPCYKRSRRKLTELFGTEHAFRIERGVTQTAQLWREADGSENDFETFCKNNFIADPAKLDKLFASLERNFEVLNGYFHRIDLTLKEPIQLQGYMPDEIDMLFAGYDVSSHLNDDLYANKIAFITSLNFPFYSLKEKTELGQNWSEKQWAFARMGDQFISRVPAHIQQNISTTLTQADAYIADYNIYMGNLRNNAQKQLFASDMKLISHWGLRDELKSNYPDAVNGLEKQRMIYKVMQRYRCRKQNDA